MDQKPALSIVVPCYNEEDNISSLLARFASALSGREDVEVLLVDNGSSDRTGAAIEDCIAEKGYRFARKVLVPENQGYGFGILSGLAAAQGAVLAWTHADLQTDPSDVLAAYRIYLAEAAKTPNVFVKGHRRSRPFLEKLLSFGMQLTASTALGCRLAEINAQPKLFPRAFYTAVAKNAPHDFSLDLYMLYLAKKLNYRILSLPVDFSQRQSGQAKGGSGSPWPVRWKLIRRSFLYIFDLRSKLIRSKGNAA